MATPSSHEATDREISHLARQLSEVIERAAPEERAELREFAKDLVSESTEQAVTPIDAVTVERKPLGFLTTLLPFLVAGFFLLFVLPPVGIVFLLFGIGIAIWGVIHQVVTHEAVNAGGNASGNGTADVPPA